MEIRNKFIAALVTLLIFIAGCKDEGTVDTPIEPPVQNENSPQLIEPANNAILSSVILKWAAFENAASYHVQLSKDANFITQLYVDTVLSATEVTVNISSLNTSIFYYWRVLASLNGGGNTGWSAIWRFSVILPPPPAPLLLLPPNNSTDQSFMPLFSWGVSPTAEAYRLQVSTNPAFSNMVLDNSVSATELQCPPFILITGSQYFWRVQASNSNGVSMSDWSEVFAFTTIDGPVPFSISGRITFADTNFLPAIEQYYYSIEAFEDGNWPPSGNLPVSGDSLIIQRINNEYIAEYILRNLPDNNYTMAVVLRQRFFSFQPVIVGVFGCDTSRTIFSNCAFTPPGTIINGGNGIENINILSWADSSKSIF
jgi:hypothetical protein